MDLSLYNAALPIEMQGAQKPPLTPQEKVQWNGFIDYLDKQGLRGSTALDNRDTGLGAKLMAQYQKVNPAFNLTYDRVGDVQQDLQDYRKQLIDKYKSGKAQADSGIKSPDEIMSGLSPVDGWLGSKTSSYKYPTAQATIQGKKTDYGVNTAAYDAAMYGAKSK
jgi:hypothetical protein